jgi:hypothetical protein
MRWHTYDRLAEKYRYQQGMIDRSIADFLGLSLLPGWTRDFD